MKEIRYEDIAKANETIKVTDIKGKDYAEVNQRIKAFRMVYPNGSIETEMTSNENGVCIFKAIIRNENGDVIATGTAYEKENSTFINKTSYIENCETSAVGRALGMCGFGIDTSVASAEEVENAIQNQKTKPKKEKTSSASVSPYDFQEKQMTEEQLMIISNLEPKLKDDIRKKYKKDPSTLTGVEAMTVINILTKKGLIKTKEEIEIEKKDEEEVF